MSIHAYVHVQVLLPKAEDELIEAKFFIKQLKAENTSLSRRSDDGNNVSVRLCV